MEVSSFEEKSVDLSVPRYHRTSESSPLERGVSDRKGVDSDNLPQKTRIQDPTLSRLSVHHSRGPTLTLTTLLWEEKYRGRPHTPTT